MRGQIHQGGAHVRHREKKSPQTKERGLRRSQLRPHLDLGLVTSRAVGRSSLLLKPQSVAFLMPAMPGHYSASSKVDSSQRAFTGCPESSQGVVCTVLLVDGVVLSQSPRGLCFDSSSGACPNSTQSLPTTSTHTSAGSVESDELVSRSACPSGCTCHKTLFYVVPYP